MSAAPVVDPASASSEESGGERELSRPLSGMERGFVLLDRVRSWNGVPLFTVRGPIDEAGLRLAVRRLQARHPLLRVRLDGDALRETPRYTTSAVAPPSVAVEERRGEDHWLDVAERELNAPFPEGAPLTRFVWLRGAGVHDLLCPQHHVGADAHSAVVMGRDLLADLGRLAAGEELPPVEELPLRPPLADLLPKQAHGLRMFGTMTRFLFRELRAAAGGAPRKLASGLSFAGGNRLVHRRLDVDSTARLREACRARGVTLHGLLCAALLRAAHEETGGGGCTMGCFSAVNLRDRITLHLDDEQGLYISQVTHFHPLGDGRGAFELAAEVKRSIVRLLDAGDQYLTVPRMGLFIRSGERADERFARRIGGLSGAAVGVTNLGQVRMPDEYGPLRLERMNVSVGVSAVGQLSVAASTFGGSLTLNFIYIEPLLERAAIARMADRVVHELTTSL